MKRKKSEPIIRKVKHTSVVTPEDPSIYKRKYYKVILHDIDPAKETTASFAIKMSMRLRAPMPRVKQMLKTMPCTIKSGMSVSQANKLFAVLEELGGRASVEYYYLTPGQDERGRPAVEGLATKSTKIGSASSFNCPSCGWENEAGADHCLLCLEVFRRKQKSAPAAPERDVPVDDPSEGAPDTTVEDGTGLIIIGSRWIVLAAFLIVLILALLILK